MTALLFATVVLIWGAGALATGMQVVIVPPPWSVALRMLVAGTLLLAIARWRREPLAVAKPDRPFVALQGLLFFAVAFMAFYEATRHIASGLAALVLSTSSLLAALIGRATLGSALPASLVAGAALGIAGVAIVFGPALVTLAPQTSLGAALAGFAAVATAGGTVVGARNQRAGLPATVLVGWSALVGAAASALWALVSAAPLPLDLSVRYLGSLFYLAVFATCIATIAFFELVRRLGPGRAAYAFTVVPVLALVLSALFEGLRLDLRIALGAAVILAGNLLVLRG